MATVPWLNNDEDSAWRGLRRVNLLALAQINRDLQRDSRLSAADYEVLTSLSESEGDRCRFGHLAQRTRWSTSRLSHHIDRMRQRDLVDRVDRVDDARGSDIVLTEFGRATIEAAAPRHVRSVRRNIFDQLSEQQVAQLADIVSTILEHYEPGNDQTSS